MLSVLIVQILNVAVNIYTGFLLVYCMMSFFPFKQRTVEAIFNALAALCVPVLNIFRKSIPSIGGALDLSPIFALVVIQGLVRVLSFVLYALPI
ncbi:MAG: YggT family protein [Eggerthellaceae bacterium]|nr:YggT family protein [Eggerthellaceae bacterium]